VYNPIKQAQDHDPHGRFVRQWLPAMRQVPDTWLFEPWLMPDTMQTHLGVFVGGDINSDTPSALVQPVVDLAQATREAKQLLHSRRQTDEVKAAKKAVVDKHASRKNWGTRSVTSRRSAASTQTDKQQLGFDF
jgi:deoxyribodipyrimidine photo-lyase